MAIKQLSLKGLDIETLNIKYFVELNEQTYIFSVRWSNYCKCAFLSISDYNDNPIISGLALTNKLKIRNSKLPYTMFFIHLMGETYEPTIDNISSEFALVYDDESEVS